SEQRLNFLTPRTAGAIGVQFPDTPVAVRTPAVDPVTHVQGSIRTEIESGGEDAAHHLFMVTQFKRGSLGAQLEAVYTRLRGITDEFCHEKSVFVGRAEGRPRIIHHTSRPAYKIGNAWRDVSRLPIEPRQVHAFVHPDLIRIIGRITVLSVLPIAAPSSIGTIDDVHQALLFSGMVPVIVLTDDIAIFVKYELVCIAQPMGEYLKVGTVRIGPHNHTAIGIPVETAVPDLPIQSPIGAVLDT